MLGRRQKLKYEIVENAVDEDIVEVGKIRRKVLTKQCVWSSACTVLLITLYFIPSIGLTFYQRWVYNKFKFPLTVVIIHMLIKLFLAALIRALLSLRSPRPRVAAEWPEYLLGVIPTGTFSGLDIGFSNWGLGLTCVSLYSMTKSTAIIFILAFAILFKLEKKSWSLCTIIAMISLGLFLFTYKASQFNFLGFMLILIASICSGLRWTCVQMLMQKSKMGMKNPVDMILHMQPWMIAALVPFVGFKEVPALLDLAQKFNGDQYPEFVDFVHKTVFGAFIAFFMEFSEVLVVNYTSSLTLSIAGIFKEILIVTMAVVFNGDELSGINQIGLLICLGGTTTHVVHKLKTSSHNLQNSANNSKLYEFREHGEVGESLLNDLQEKYALSSDSEHSDSQKLFDLLNRHDR